MADQVAHPYKSAHHLTYAIGNAFALNFLSETVLFILSM
jgi:hypothetical protein